MVTEYGYAKCAVRIVSICSSGDNTNLGWLGLMIPCLRLFPSPELGVRGSNFEDSNQEKLYGRRLDQDYVQSYHPFYLRVEPCVYTGESRVLLSCPREFGTYLRLMSKALNHRSCKPESPLSFKQSLLFSRGPHDPLQLFLARPRQLAMVSFYCFLSSSTLFGYPERFSQAFGQIT
ncbi:hypothetical protein VNO77_22805 [Canavalia gladiata]|uniref:Uncharacterized protein n=1 Tax=Canavalia gladiata TaxID=3824 RepID=A0AAN9L8I7_CANGL